MCLADLYRDREPLPGLITFPTIDGIQDVMGFRFDNDRRDSPGLDRGRSTGMHSDRQNDTNVMVCSAGVWRSLPSRWQLRAFEREYCRLIQGELHIEDRTGRRWDFSTGSAFLLLRGFIGSLEVVQPAVVAYTVFALPIGGALDWCMTGEGRTALGQEQIVEADESGRLTE